MRPIIADQFSIIAAVPPSACRSYVDNEARKRSPLRLARHNGIHVYTAQQAIRPPCYLTETVWAQLSAKWRKVKSEFVLDDIGIIRSLPTDVRTPSMQAVENPLTMLSWMFTIACCLVVGLGLRILYENLYSPEYMVAYRNKQNLTNLGYNKVSQFI